jgi:hypothetical protein
VEAEAEGSDEEKPEESKRASAEREGYRLALIGQLPRTRIRNVSAVHWFPH